MNVALTAVAAKGLEMVSTRQMSQEQVYVSLWVGAQPCWAGTWETQVWSWWVPDRLAGFEQINGKSLEAGPGRRNEIMWK